MFKQLYDSENNLIGEGECEEDGTRSGIWTLYYKNGVKAAKGTYTDVYRSGNWKYYNESGVLVSQGWHTYDTRVGRWRDYYPSGNVKIIYDLETGVKNGPCKIYYDAINMIQAEGKFVDGEMHGLWKFYDESGNLTSENVLEDGVSKSDNPINKIVETISGKKRKCYEENTDTKRMRVDMDDDSDS